VSTESEINEAILNAFNRNELDRLLQFEFETSLDEVAGESDLVTSVFHVVRWAYQNSVIEQLISAATKEKPNNEVLRGLKLNKSLITSTTPASMELIVYRLERLESEFSKLYDITVGPDGSNGLRSAVEDMGHDIRELKEEISKELGASELTRSNGIRVLIWGGALMITSNTALIIAATLNWI